MISPLLLVILLGAAQSTGQMSPTSDVSSNRVKATGAARSRSIADHMADEVGASNFATFDGVTDDTERLQQAIDLSRPADGWTPVGKCVKLPKGTAIVSSPIRVYSGTCIVGHGTASKIQASAGFSGTGVIIGAAASGTNTTALTNLVLRDFSVAGSQSGLWAINLATMATITQPEIRNITFTTAKGLNACSYVQGAEVSRLLSMGSLDQLACIAGNWNKFELLDKEGNTGSSVDPYILVTGHTNGRSVSNVFREVLLEQTTSANKTLFSADNTQALVLENVWLEPTATNGYGLSINRSIDFQIRGHLSHTGTWGKVQIANNSYGRVAHADVDGENVKWQSIFETDATSHVVFEIVQSRQGDAPYPVDTAWNASSRSHTPRSWRTAPITGIVPVIQQRNTPIQNLLVNPSFEQGAKGWSGYGSIGTALAGTVTFPQSEVGPGVMLRAADMTGTNAVWQRKTIPTEWVGRPMTLTGKVKIAGSGFVAPYVSGVAGQAGQFGENVVSSDGWQLISVTAVPQSAGNLDVGAWIMSATTTTVAYLDEFRLGFGDLGAPGSDAFQEISLGDITLTTGTAAPSNGTWKLGSFIFNSAPFVGSPVGWRAVTAGTPGTWEPIYAMTNATAAYNPLILDEAGTIEHALWDGSSLITTLGGLWTMNGTVPQVAGVGQTPPGAGPFSDANYYDATVATTTGDFSVCAVFIAASDSSHGLTDVGVSSGGYRLEHGTGLAMQITSSGVGSLAAPNSAIAGVVNVLCGGKSGSNAAIKLNLGTYTTGALTFVQGSGGTYVGRSRFATTAYAGTLLEVWYSNTAPSDALFTSIQERVQLRAGVSAW